MEISGIEKCARYLMIVGGVVVILGGVLFKTGVMKKFKASGAPRLAAMVTQPRRHVTSADYTPAHGGSKAAASDAAQMQGDSPAEAGPEGTFQRGAPEQQGP
jgi:hypothetical protein